MTAILRLGQLKLNNIFSIAGGMKAYDGECKDHVIKNLGSNVGECEIACQENLDCVSATFQFIGTPDEDSGSCNLMNGTCDTLEAKQYYTTFKMQGTFPTFKKFEYTTKDLVSLKNTS